MYSGDEECKQNNPPQWLVIIIVQSTAAADLWWKIGNPLQSRRAGGGKYHITVGENGSACRRAMRRSGSAYPGQHGDALDVVRLRKEVEAADRVDAVAGATRLLEDVVQVSRLRVDVLLRANRKPQISTGTKYCHQTRRHIRKRRIRSAGAGTRAVGRGTGGRSPCGADRQCS